MAQVTIDSFAKQIGISIEKLLDQLEQAGIAGKTKDDILEDDEKLTLLQYLKGGGGEKSPARSRISLKRTNLCASDGIQEVNRVYTPIRVYRTDQDLGAVRREHGLRDSKERTCDL